MRERARVRGVEVVYTHWTGIQVYLIHTCMSLEAAPGIARKGVG